MYKLLMSRSALLSYQTCNRKFYYQYQYKGHGVVDNKLNIDLLIGEACHRGLQHLLEHCRIDHKNGDFTDTCIDEAVKYANDLYITRISTNDIDIHKSEDLGYVILETGALIEGLIRSFALYRLPSLLNEYDILEVEKEDIYNINESSIFLGKADGLFKRKSDNKLVVLSIKTDSYLTENTIRDNTHDMQGISEIVIIKDRLNFLYDLLKTRNHLELGYDDNKLNYDKDWIINEDVYNYMQDCYSKNLKNIEINLVQYEHLIKGGRRQDPAKSGIYKRQSPLLHPYKLNSGIDFKSKIFNPDEFMITFGQGRPPKNWEKIDIWKIMPVKQWIDMLNTSQVQPEIGNILKDIIYTSDLIFRSNEEQEEWVESFGQVINNIDRDLTIYNLHKDSAASRNSFNKRFPKNTQSCHNFYGKDCIFVDVCHNGLRIDEAFEFGTYQIRHPHHDLEREYFKEKGWLKDE